MEAVLFGFALGAGTAFAARHGRRLARRAVGWTAKNAGWVTAHVATALEQAQRVARDEFDRGRRQRDPHEVEVRPLGSNGVSATINANGVETQLDLAAPDQPR